MIELKRHIEILLLDNDCVIVPGLGGFVAHHVDARYDVADGSFLPPLRTIGFNQKLCMNDSLLAQSYVEAYDLSFPEAMAKIETEVDEIKRGIENDGYYDFNDIGTLVVNAQGYYEFEPCESGILTPELYGLSSFDIDKIVLDGNPVVNRDVKTLVLPAVAPVEESSSESALKPDFLYGESKLAEKLSEDDGSNDDKTISIRVSLIRNVLVAACAIIAFLMFATPINNGTTNAMIGGVGNGLMYNLVAVNGSGQPTNASVNHDVKLVKPSTDNVAADAKSLKVEVKSLEEDVAAKTEKDVYSIVLACRITRANAEAYVEKLNKEGYSDARLSEPKGESLKVVYGCYDTKEKALEQLRNLREKTIFENAWIFKEK